MAVTHASKPKVVRFKLLIWNTFFEIVDGNIGQCRYANTECDGMMGMPKQRALSLVLQDHRLEIRDVTWSDIWSALILLNAVHDAG